MRSVIARRVALALAAISAIVLVAITIIVLRNSSNNHTTAPATTPTVATSATSEIPSLVSEDDKQRFASLMAERRSGYDCPANDAVIQAGGPVKALVLCPDYIARVTFTSDDPANPPKVDYISSDPDTQVRPITVNIVPVHSCGNDGVTGVPVTCTDYWRIQWSISSDPAFAFVSLGENAQNITTHDGSNRLWWTGAFALGTKQSDQAYSAANTRMLEVYAGNVAKQIAGAPVSVDRMGPMGS